MTSTFSDGSLETMSKIKSIKMIKSFSNFCIIYLKKHSVSNLSDSMTPGHHTSMQFQNFMKRPMVILARYAGHNQMSLQISLELGNTRVYSSHKHFPMYF